MNRIYRAQLHVWILFVGLSGLPWLAVWGNAYSLHGIDTIGVVYASLISAFAIGCLISFQIVLTPTEVIFRSLFRGSRSIRHDQIKMVRLAWNITRQIGGPMRLIIEPHDGSGARELRINAKVFSKEAIDAVLGLGARVAQVDDGGLRDGIVMKALKKEKRSQKK